MKYFNEVGAFREELNKYKLNCGESPPPVRDNEIARGENVLSPSR